MSGTPVGHSPAVTGEPSGTRKRAELLTAPCRDEFTVAPMNAIVLTALKRPYTFVVRAISAADLAMARLSLEAELANDYIAVRGFDAVLEVLRQSIAAYQQAVEVAHLRSAGKIASGLDLARALSQGAWGANHRGPAVDPPDPSVSVAHSRVGRWLDGQGSAQRERDPTLRPSRLRHRLQEMIK